MGIWDILGKELTRFSNFKLPLNVPQVLVPAILFPLNCLLCLDFSINLLLSSLLLFLPLSDLHSSAWENFLRGKSDHIGSLFKTKSLTRPTILPTNFYSPAIMGFFPVVCVHCFLTCYVLNWNVSSPTSLQLVNFYLTFGSQLKHLFLGEASCMYTYYVPCINTWHLFMGIDDQAKSYTRGGTTSVSVYHCTELNEYSKDEWMIDEETHV